MDLNDWLTLIAILLGPVLGVFIARFIDDYKDVKNRRMEIFRILMRTRGSRLSYDHVGALNLVEVEFFEQEKIITAWKDYLTELSIPFSEEENERFLKSQKLNELLTKLIHEIAKVLNLKIEQLDILRTNYSPQGWQNDEDQQRYLRILLINLLGGHGALPVQVRETIEDDGNSPFPPSPYSEN